MQRTQSNPKNTVIPSVDDAFLRTTQRSQRTSNSIPPTTASEVDCQTYFLSTLPTRKNRTTRILSTFPRKSPQWPLLHPSSESQICRQSTNSLEKQGFLRHVRVSNEGNIVPTNSSSSPFSLAIKGDSTKYVQNGMNQSLFETKGTKWKSALSTRKPALRNCISILWITWPVMYFQCTEYESLYRKTRHFTNKPSKILYEQALMDWLIDWCIMRLLSHGCYPRVYFCASTFFPIFILAYISWHVTRHPSPRFACLIFPKKIVVWLDLFDSQFFSIRA